MRFIALPVKVGNSFLLKDENNIILVDGGMNQQHIVKLLS
jgi:metal-dependent hydrolase (beta-lactamase superfamily II)